MNGTIPLHRELEEEIADWMGTEDALVFTTGYQANLGCLSGVLGASDTVIADSGDHASILDGCKLSGARLRPFRHQRLDKLEQMLERAAGDGGGVLVVVDGVYSMEGDVCDVRRGRGALPRPRRPPDGRRGPRRRRARARAAPGACELYGVEDRVDLRMGTFSKSLASCGGFIAGPAEVIDYLRISSRPFLFTAAAVPAAIGGRARGGADLPLGRGPGAVRARARQRRLPAPRACASSATGSSSPRRCPTAREVITPIVPVVIGDDCRPRRSGRRSGTRASTRTWPSTPPCRRAAR